MDKFTVAPDQHRIGWWRVWRVYANGHQFPLAKRFKLERTAKAYAYECEVIEERRHNRRVYLGD